MGRRVGAGYESVTGFLPPEHFCAWYFRDKLIKSLHEGPLEGQGPDGKILVVMDEGCGEWGLAKVLVTLQQQERVSFIDFTGAVDEVLRDAWRKLRLKAMMARKLAVELVAGGSDEALVRVCFAPGMDKPLCVDITSSVKPATDPQEFFTFANMKQHITVSDLDYNLAALGSFYNPELSFNTPG